MKKPYLSVLMFSIIVCSSLLFAAGSEPPNIDGVYQVSSLAHLEWISTNSTSWSSDFLQTADIDASATSGWDGNKGFPSIGNTTNAFTGTYDGGGHTISDLFINRSDGYQAFLGRVSGSGAIIKNLGLTDINFTGGGRTAGLVGQLRNGADVQNCYTTGTVDGSGELEGGLVGECRNGSSITKSYSTASVTGATKVGGLVGYFYGNGGIISECYSKGTVTGDQIGGFIGRMYQATINNCYSSSSLSPTGTAYGAFCNEVGNSACTIENCYAVGDAGNTDTDHGFVNVGYNGTATYTNNFFDTETTQQATAGSTTGGADGSATGKTITEMKTEATFTDWDFTNIWEIVPSDGNNYPRLKNNIDDALPVELTTFIAEVKGGAVLLTWATATEVNNYGFEIQKSVSSGKISDWSTIGFVVGAGNSNSPKQYSFIDATSNGVASYRLKQVDVDGGFEYSKVVTVAKGLAKTELFQNNPNPFNPTTQISFSLSALSNVKVSVFNILGEKVAELVNSKMESGSYKVNFNASNLTSGTYVYRIETPNYIKSMKMLLLK